MNNFGVIELAGAKKTSAPGWAYVPDTSINLSSVLQPGNRKRARNAAGVTLGDLSARQETKKRKEVEALDRDGGRDNTIPLPVKHGRGMSLLLPPFIGNLEANTTKSPGKEHTKRPKDTTVTKDFCQPPGRLSGISKSVGNQRDFISIRRKREP